MKRWREAVLVIRGWWTWPAALAGLVLSLGFYERSVKRAAPAPIVLIADSTRPFFNACRVDEHGVPRLVSLPLIVQTSAP